MSVDTFIDTNIFIYHLDPDDPAKRTIAAALIRDALDSGRGCISTQVVQEYLNVVLRKAAVPLPSMAASRYLHDVLVPLLQVYPSVEIYQRTLEIHDRYQIHFYDALIVASALSAGCRTLFSEDLQHGLRIGELSVVNPFAGV